MAGAFSTTEYKVIIIGGLGVGKTSLLLRYVHDTFEDRVSKFVAEEKKTVKLSNGVEIVLDIWDTAGQERFQSITNRFYSDSQAVIIVYDVTGEETIQDLDFWVREVNYYLLRELENGLPVLFVGNKKDLLNEDSSSPDSSHRPDDVCTNPGGVVLRQVQELCNMNGFLRPFECSAKTGENVQRIFHTIASELVKRKQIKPNLVQQPLPNASDGNCACK